MKKFFTTLAFTLCLTAMVSCGGDKKESTSNAGIKAKAESIVRRAAQATMTGNQPEYQRIVEEEQEYAKQLTPEQLKYYNKCALEYGAKMLSD